ncbi:phage holin family protein [soil metagenome]
MSHTPQPPPEPSVGELTSQLGEQVSRRIRDELALAQIELKEKGKRAGIGAGLFGGAGVVGLYGGACLVAAAVLALALAVDAWLAALIIGVVLLAIAGGVALMGKSQLQQATPPVPTEAVESTKKDIQAAKGHQP